MSRLLESKSVATRIPHVSIDSTASKQLQNQLADYYHRSVLDTNASFVCQSAVACQASVSLPSYFAAGQLSYVGDAYATDVDGRPFRILVVPMQIGQGQRGITMTIRAEQVLVRVNGDRNPHMWGVIQALRVLHGLAPGTDHDGEILRTATGDTHLYRAFAMVNACLCSRASTPIVPGSASTNLPRKGNPTTVMYENCSSHLAQAIAILRPTIVQTQGRLKNPTARSPEWVLRKLADQIDWFSQEVARVTIAGHRFVLCALRHPTRNWWSPSLPYAKETALPALRLARRLVLEGQ